MFEKVQNLKLKSSVSAFNGLIYNYDKKNDLHMIACLDVDMVNLTKFKLISPQDTIEQTDCELLKINPIDDSTQFCLIEFHCLKFLNFDLFCLISSNGLHVTFLNFL